MVSEDTVFISYSRADSTFADKLDKDLHLHGIATWMDRNKIIPGQIWSKETQNAAEQCVVMLVLLSPKSVESENVRNEYAFAQRKKIEVIPLIYRDCNVPMPLIGIDFVDFRTDDEYDRGLQRLLGALKNYIALREMQRQANKEDVIARQLVKVEIEPYKYDEHPIPKRSLEYFIGRKQEFSRLNDWLMDANHRQPIMLVWSLSGMGKSAFTSAWFRSLDEHKMDLAGSFRWDFAENPAFDLFIKEAILYLTGYPDDKSSPEDIVFNILKKHPYLFIFDSFEGALNVGSSHTDDNNRNLLLAKAKDPRLDQFIERFLDEGIKSSLLVVARVRPAILYSEHELRPYCQELPLKGLRPEESHALFHQILDVEPQQDVMDLFKNLEYHPLAVRVISGLVKYDHKPLERFERIIALQQGVPLSENDFSKMLSKMFNGVIQQLDPKTLRVLEVIAATLYSESTLLTYPLLMEILISGDSILSDPLELDRRLEELETRNLLEVRRPEGRNNLKNVEFPYWLHALIRQVAEAHLRRSSDRQHIYQMHKQFFTKHFTTTIKTDWTGLIPQIQVFNDWVALGEMNHAVSFFKDGLEGPLIDQLMNTTVASDLLNPLLSDKMESSAKSLQVLDEADIHRMLGKVYHFRDQPKKAVEEYQKALTLCKTHDFTDVSEKARRNEMLEDLRVKLADALLTIGEIDQAFLMTLENAEDGITQDKARPWVWIQLLLMTCGERKLINWKFLSVLARTESWNPLLSPAKKADNLALGLLRLHDTGQSVGLLPLIASLFNGWSTANLIRRASKFVEIANEVIEEDTDKKTGIRAKCLKGMIHFSEGQFADAKRELEEATSEAHEADYTEGELLALVALVRLERQVKDYEKAREHLEIVKKYVIVGPYPLYQVDALIEESYLAYSEGHEDAENLAREALQVSTRAGGYYYERGVIAAISLLKRMNKPIDSSFHLRNLKQKLRAALYSESDHNTSSIAARIMKLRSPYELITGDSAYLPSSLALVSPPR